MARPDDGVVTVLLPPAVGPSSVDGPQRALHEPMDRGSYRLVVDMSATDYMGSALLGCLVQAAARAQQAGGDLRLYGPGWGPRGPVPKFLALLRLGVTFRTFETEEEAIRSFDAPTSDV